MTTKAPIAATRIKCAWCTYRCWSNLALAHHARVSHREVELPSPSAYAAAVMVDAHAKDAHKWRLYLLQEKRKVTS